MAGGGRQGEEQAEQGAAPSMGGVDARFTDWRIGVAPHWAQLRVDRNFALDLHP